MRRYSCDQTDNAAHKKFNEKLSTTAVADTFTDISVTVLYYL